VAVDAEERPEGDPGAAMATRATAGRGCRWGVESASSSVGSAGLREVLIENLGGGPPAERLARPAVQRARDGGEVFRAVACEVCALGEVLAQQPVGVLVRPALLGRLSDELCVRSG